jgi:hypothetical protein
MGEQTNSRAIFGARRGSFVCGLTIVAGVMTVMQPTPVVPKDQAIVARAEARLTREPVTDEATFSDEGSTKYYNSYPQYHTIIHRAPYPVYRSNPYAQPEPRKSWQQRRSWRGR